MPYIEITPQNITTLENQIGDSLDLALVSLIQISGSFFVSFSNPISSSSVSIGNGIVLTSAHNFVVSDVLSPNLSNLGEVLPNLRSGQSGPSRRPCPLPRRR